MRRQVTKAEVNALHQFAPRYVNGGDRRLVDAVVAEILRRTTAEAGTTWWETWNAVANAARGLEVTPLRCLSCDGRIVNVRNPGRNLARTGSPYICGECRGTRRGTSTWVGMRPLPADVVAHLYSHQP